MSFFIKNKKYFYSVLLFAVAFNFLFLPLTALADPAPAKEDSSLVGEILTWITAKPLLFISSFISMLFGAFFGLALSLEALFIDYVIDPNTFSLIHTPVVTLGWGITRDIANMFFILILLVIAFATVLKIQSYAIKQLWWKILVAALLINFSLVIAGVVIDFTQILTGFFLNQITGGGDAGGQVGTITKKLASGMQILNFYNPAPPTSMMGGIEQFGDAAVAAVVGVILTLVGLVITVFVFGALAIFLIIRILYIWFLLIVAPIAWMLWIIPATSGYFKQWWDKFIQWTFFAPVYVFMMYLSLSIFDATGKIDSKVFGVFPNAWKAAPGLTTVSLPSAIFQWIFVIAMMFGSLIVAKSFGVLPGKLLSSVTGATKSAARASALWGVKTYGRVLGGATSSTGAAGAAGAGTAGAAGTGTRPSGTGVPIVGATPPVVPPTTPPVVRAPVNIQNKEEVRKFLEERWAEDEAAKAAEARAAEIERQRAAREAAKAGAAGITDAAGTGTPRSLRKTIGDYLTGAKGGKYTASLKNTPNNLITAIVQGAVSGSGLWKKKKQKFKLPSGETIELEPESERPEEKSTGEK